LKEFLQRHSTGSSSTPSSSGESSILERVLQSSSKSESTIRALESTTQGLEATGKSATEASTKAIEASTKAAVDAIAKATSASVKQISNVASSSSSSSESWWIFQIIESLGSAGTVVTYVGVAVGVVGAIYGFAQFLNYAPEFSPNTEELKDELQVVKLLAESAKEEILTIKETTAGIQTSVEELDTVVRAVRYRHNKNR